MPRGLWTLSSTTPVSLRTRCLDRSISGTVREEMQENKEKGFYTPILSWWAQSDHRIEEHSGVDPDVGTAQVILVVDDEPSIADNIIYALTTEGFEAVYAPTGSEALDKLLAMSVDLIVLDIGLPDINGFELARQIRQRSAIPIIFVTARADEVDKIVGLELGADDYVVKPFSPRELSARVKAVLRRARNVASDERPSAPPDELIHGPFKLDQIRYRVSYHGTALVLSRVEFRLLGALIEAPGQVFSREQLLDKAWEHGGISLERTVDTHIKTLRSKCKEISAHDPIVTHRGLGYSMRDDY